MHMMVKKLLRQHFESDKWEEKLKKEGRAVLKIKFSMQKKTRMDME